MKRLPSSRTVRSTGPDGIGARSGRTSRAFFASEIIGPQNSTLPAQMFLPLLAQIAITNVTVIDARDSVPRVAQTVVIQGNKITAVQPASQRPPAGARLVDGRGKFLIPGLW